MYPQSTQEEKFTADADMSGTGGQGTFTPAKPVEIIEFGYIITTAVTDAAGGLVLQIDKRITAGTDTGLVSAAGGTLTLTSAQVNALTAGKVMTCRPAQPITVVPGQQAILNLSTAPDTGAGIPYIVYRDAQMLDANVTSQTLVAS